nr:MAG TPA: Cell wall hydrolase autolysin [Caudoviricetes sp.]
MNKVILNVGHGGVRKDPGACGNGFEEHEWNKDFVNNYIVPECKEQGLEYAVVYQEYYSTLPQKINGLANKGDITLSFHLNAADETAHGAEMLYWHNSKNSKELAEFIQEANVEATHLRNRGIKPRVKGDRGWALLYKTTPPCIIIESGFITNLEDMKTLEETKKLLAKYYVAAVKNYFETSA